VINRKRAQRNREGIIKNKRELNVWKQGKIEQNIEVLRIIIES